MVLTRAYPMTDIAPSPLSRLVLDHRTMPSHNSKVNPIETRYSPHITVSFRFTLVGYCDGAIGFNVGGVGGSIAPDLAHGIYSMIIGVVWGAVAGSRLSFGAGHLRPSAMG